MALLIENKCLFFHIPKTGGNSLRSYLAVNTTFQLKEISHKHATPDFFYGQRSAMRIKHIRNLLGQETIKLVLIRNPFEWYESWYKYQISRGIVKWGESKWRESWHPISELNSISFETFDTFVLGVIEKNPTFLTDLYARYTSSSNTVTIKLEDIAKNPLRELSKTGISQERLLNNQFPLFRPSPKLKLKWSKSLRDAVKKNEKLIFEKFEYSDK